VRTAQLNVRISHAAWFACALALWSALGVVAALFGPTLTAAWPEWRWAFAALAAWGVNLLLVVYGIGPPFRASRPPLLAASFAFLVTVFGLGSYWATIQLYPLYRVSIEYAAWFVATCTTVALGAAVIVTHSLRHRRTLDNCSLEWDWSRLQAVSCLAFAIAAVGTLGAIARIGYVPILAGDPSNARVDFPTIGGLWYRLSMLGGVTALLVAVQAAGRRATFAQYVLGIASLMFVGLYGPRFFIALPLGVAVLLWDRFRRSVPLRRVALLLVVVAPVFAIVGYMRERNQNLAFLGPVGLLFYGTLGEFRDLGWALDYYGFGDRFLHGGTLGSAVVPLLPTPVWQLVGIDKAAVYAHSSASILAEAMGQTRGQRIGAYGEFFMNFGWIGALVGATLYGALLAYLDDRLTLLSPRDVRGVFLALATATTVFALIGQLDMFTSTLTGLGYPLLLATLVAARRANRSGVTT